MVAEVVLGVDGIAASLEDPQGVFGLPWEAG